jgi:hypothetical protein
MTLYEVITNAYANEVIARKYPLCDSTAQL